MGVTAAVSPGAFAPVRQTARRAEPARSVLAALLALALGLSVMPLVQRAITAATPATEVAPRSETAVRSLDDLPVAERAAVEAQMEAALYYVRPDAAGTGLSIPNPAGGFDATLAAGRLSVITEADAAPVVLSTAGVVRGSGELISGSRPTISHSDTTVTLDHGTFREWLRNSPGGLEQGWTLSSRPDGAGEVAVVLEVVGASVIVDSDTDARFVPAAGNQVSYRGLRVFDAAGRDLPARFEPTPRGVEIRFSDAGARYPVVVDPVIQETQVIDPVPNAAVDRFGESVDVDGRWMVVGAPGDRTTPTTTYNVGSVYVYFDETGAGDWALRHQLRLEPPNSFGGFGHGVAVEVEPEGITVAAGSNNANRAAVWALPGDPASGQVAEATPQILIPQAMPGVGFNRYGRSVDLDSGLLVLGMDASRQGMFRPDGPDLGEDPDPFSERIGQVDVLRRSGGFGTPFLLEARLGPPGGVQEPDRALRDASQEFGTSVAVEGELIVVGAVGDDGVLTPTAGSAAEPIEPGISQQHGAVHVFRRDAGSWSPISVIREPTPVAGGTFGASVAISQGDILAGAPLPATTAGRAHLFELADEADPAWPDAISIASDDPASPVDEATVAGRRFGNAVAFSPAGDAVVVGAHNDSFQPNNQRNGSAYVYTRSEGSVPTFVGRVADTNDHRTFSGGAHAATSVGHRGDRIIVGSPRFGEKAAGWPGAVMTFEAADLSAPATRIFPVGVTYRSSFGALVAQDRDVLVVVAPEEIRGTDEQGPGAIHVFNRVDGAWELEQVVLPSHGVDPSVNARFGSLAIRVERDADGEDIGLAIALGIPTDSDADPDARGDTLLNQPIPAEAGTVGLFRRTGGPGTTIQNTGSAVWAGGHDGWAKPGQFDTATMTEHGHFGADLAFTADGTLVVGEPGADGGRGAIHRFERINGLPTSVGQYAFRETIPGTFEGEQLGLAVAAHGHEVVVGSATANGNSRVRVFGDGAPAVDLDPVADFAVGMASAPHLSLDVKDGRVAVGSAGESAVRVYSSPEPGVPYSLELHHQGDPTDQVGADVAFNRGGDHLTLAAGRPGADRVTLLVASPRPDGSATWSVAADLVGSDAGDADAAGTSLTNWPEQGGVHVGAPRTTPILAALPQEHFIGRVLGFDTASIAPPPGPTAFVDVSVPPEVLAGASHLPIVGLPPSLLTQHASAPGSIAAAPLGGIDLSQPPAGSSLAVSPLSAVPLSAVPLSAVPLSAVPLSAVPLSAVGGWEAVLAGTPFEGLPLQSVSLTDVYDLPSVQALTIGQLNLSATPLSAVPLSAVALGALPLSAVPLDPSADLGGWCDALNALGTDPAEVGLDCMNPDAPSNGSVTLMALALSGVPLSAVPLSAVPLSAVELAGSPLSAVPLSAVDLVGSPLSAVPLSAVPLSAVPLSAVPLSAVPLSAVPLSAVPLSAVELAGSPLSAVPLSAVPLSAVPLSAVPLSAVPLSAVELAGSPLSAVPLSAVDLAVSPLSAVPLSAVAQLSEVVDCEALDCDRPGVTLGEAARRHALHDGATFGDLHGALAGFRYGDVVHSVDGYGPSDFRQALADLTLADVEDFDDLVLADLPQIHRYLTLGGIVSALDGIRLGAIADRIDGFSPADLLAALADLTLADLSGFDDVTLGELPQIHQHLVLGNLVGALSGIRLADLIGVIPDGSGGVFDEADLRDALAGALGTDATLLDLDQDFDDLTLGELGEYGDTTVGDLLAAIDPTMLDDLTLGDLLLTLIARSQYPWDQLDLDSLLAQDHDGVTSSIPVTVAFSADAPDGRARDVRVTVVPPPGSAYAADSAVLAGADPHELVPDVVDGALVWTFTGLPAGAVHQLAFGLEPTLEIGLSQIKASATLLADDVSASDVADLRVKEVIEPNDTVAQASDLPDETIVLSHISTHEDLDVFAFEAEAGSRVSISLSNLDSDLDMVLYSPKASSAGIQEPSPRSIVPVQDEPAAAVAGTDEVAPEVTDDLSEPIDLGDLAVNTTSIRRGIRDEQIDTGPLHRSGTYYLAVSGYNGATNRSPYALRIKRFASDGQLACPARSVPSGTVGAALPASLPAGTNTVLLVNRSRLEGLYGASETAAALAAVERLITFVNAASQDSLGVSAAVLYVDADPDVRSAYGEWDSRPCEPETANGVVAEIVRVLDSYRDAGTQLTHVVVVGGDDVIPFARVPDKTEIANERGYASTFGAARNALTATFSTGHVLTDDAYGDLDPYGFADRVLFVSDTSVGRLVETPAEIADQLDDFVAAEGLLEVGTGLVTGYDFLSDGADEVEEALSDTYDAVDSSLISDTWTRQDLEDAIDAIEPDVASINAHFDHFRALPGEGNANHDESDLFTAAAVRGALAGDLARSMVFSMGCHGGLSASDLLVTADRELDFAQAIAAQGGVFVGNTGYGYGDTELVALSESLMAGFARRLDGALSVGEALLYAKAEYAGDLTAYGVYDEKAMMEATLYGLPFYRLAVENPPPLPPAPPVPAVSPDPASDVETSTIRVTPVHEEHETEDGERYWTGPDGSTTVHDRPVQPRDTHTLTPPEGTEAHDALVLELTTVDHVGVTPFVHQPIVDHGRERTPAAAAMTFPSAPLRVNPELLPTGEAATISLTTGYFRTTSVDGSGVQRLIEDATVAPHFAPGEVTDFTGPRFSVVDAMAVDGVLSFVVRVADDQGGAEGVRRVRVLALADPEPGVAQQWQPLDLVRQPGTDRWTGALAMDGDEIEYLVQAVDASGNVGITTNKALNFRDAHLPLDPPVNNLTVSVDGPVGTNGWYTGPVTVTAQGGAALTYEVLGATPETSYTAPFGLAEDGHHVVVVRSSDGQRVTRTIRVDQTGPQAVIFAPLEGSRLRLGEGVTARFGCVDPGSGVTACSATLDGSPVQPGADVTADAGSHTLVVTAAGDRAGHGPHSSSATFDVVGPVEITSIQVPQTPDPNSPVTVEVGFTGDPLSAPFSVTFDWDDGSATTCRSDESQAGCQVAIAPDGTSTAVASHQYTNTAATRVVTVTVQDDLGQEASGTVALHRQAAMTATPILLEIKITLLGGITIKIKSGGISAVLTDSDGNPIVGRTITFRTAAGATLCSAVTGSDGRAGCPGVVPSLVAILGGHYTATFAGDNQFKGISTTAPLLQLG